MVEVEQDAGAVTGGLVGARGAAVLEAVERDQAAGDDLVARDVVEPGDGGDAAGVAGPGRVVNAVEAVRARCGSGGGEVVVFASHEMPRDGRRFDADRTRATP